MESHFSTLFYSYIILFCSFNSSASVFLVSPKHTSRSGVTAASRLSSFGVPRYLPTPRSVLAGAPTSRVITATATSSSSSSRAEAVAAVRPELVEFAHKLADEAAVITRKYFRTPVEVDTKGDDSPVTIADRTAEDVMRRLIKSSFPEHGIFGEEAGIEFGSSKYMWVLDPVDGTKSFITGKPLFGTLIALTYDGYPILGVIDQSILKERWVGVADQGTTFNGKVVRTRACDTLRKAYMYTTTPAMFAGASEVAYNRVRDQCKIPMYGCDCYAYGLVAMGLADLVVEADLKPYDYMAVVPIIEGAGGKMTDWTGKDLIWKPSPDTGSGSGGGDGSGGLLPQGYPGEIVAAGDPRTHAETIRLLAWSPSGPQNANHSSPGAQSYEDKPLEDFCSDVKNASEGECRVYED